MKNQDNTSEHSLHPRMCMDFLNTSSLLGNQQVYLNEPNGIILYHSYHHSHLWYYHSLEILFSEKDTYHTPKIISDSYPPMPSTDDPSWTTDRRREEYTSFIA